MLLKAGRKAGCERLARLESANAAADAAAAAGGGGRTRTQRRADADAVSMSKLCASRAWKASKFRFSLSSLDQCLEAGNYFQKTHFGVYHTT